MPNCHTDDSISIHAPREGGDFHDILASFITPYFNPRPPRGGRPNVTGYNVYITEISIHAPREGGDLRCSKNVRNNFL